MSFLRRSPTVGHGAPAAKPVVAEELGAPETFGAFDAPASVEADAECVGEGLALEGVQPPTMSARATNTAPTRLAIKTKHYTGQRVLAEREREREREGGGSNPRWGCPQSNSLAMQSSPRDHLALLPQHSR
jgi:hypothetical protein